MLFEPFEIGFEAACNGLHDDLRAVVAVVLYDQFFDGGVVAACGFDKHADFAVAAEFAFPKVLALNGFVLDAGGQLLFQQQCAGFIGFFLVGKGGGDDDGFEYGHFSDGLLSSHSESERFFFPAFQRQKICIRA